LKGTKQLVYGVQNSLEKLLNDSNDSNKNNINTNNNIEKMINDLKEKFKYLEHNVYTQLKDFKNEKNEGIFIDYLYFKFNKINIYLIFLKN
jgi:hypothetical protein